MALGRPTVIAAEYGSDAEILQHGITGWRYEKGNIEGLVGAVRSVMYDIILPRRVAQRAREFVRTEATIERMVEVCYDRIRAAIDLWIVRNGSR